MKVNEAIEMFEEYRAYWNDIYRKAEEDQDFYLGETQWSPEDKKARNGRPCITVNVLPQFVHQVTNQIRQNTPHINVIPSDKQSSEKTAKVIKGLIRKIEYFSDADEVYDTAAENQVVSSLGFIRVDHDYISPGSDKQRLFIRSVQNPQSCWLDPNSVEADGGDAMGAICTQEISKKLFEKRYKGKAFVSFEKDPKHDDSRESITIAEVYVKTLEDIPPDSENETVESPEENKRVLKKAVIRRYLFSGADLLEETTFPGDYIPLVPVYGKIVWTKGKRNLISLIRNAKDPQRRYNYWASMEAELLSKAPLAPFMAAEGQIEDYEEAWTNPSNDMVLRYKTTDLEGAQVPPPQRMMPPQIPAGIINAMQGAYEDIKRSLGLYDASVGQKSNETSGIAIQARQQQGDTATFHFPDNLSRAVAQVGRVIVSAIPGIYDTMDILQIINEEEKPEFVEVNPIMGMGQMGDEEPIDLTTGSYDVRVVTGTSYATKKEEAADKMGRILERQPEMMGVFGDIFFKNLDIPDSELLSERVKRTIPPQLTEEEGQDPRVMQLQQALEQMQQQMGALQQQADGKQQELALKQQEAEADYTVKMREMDIKERELVLKEQELQFNMEKAAVEAAQAVAMSPSQGIAVNGGGY